MSLVGTDLNSNNPQASAPRAVPCSEKLKVLGEHRIVQLKTDPIWGPGVDGKGQNLLGKCLEKVRGWLNHPPVQPLSVQALPDGTRYNIPQTKP